MWILDLLGFAVWMATEVPVALLRDFLAVTLGAPLILVELVRIVLEIPNTVPGQELYLKNPANVRSVGKQIALALLSLSPLWWLLWGYRLLRITVFNLRRLLPEDFGGLPRNPSLSYTGYKEPEPSETLNYFVNGICVDENWLECNCKTLEAHLGEPVQGIYNPTHGLVIDLVECVLQRDLRFYTKSVLDTAHHVQEALARERRVRLIGHSQGGIIVSLVVDYLITYNLLTPNLEVYTFASAADKFPRAPIIAKHYGNQFDLVAWLGVLGTRMFYKYVVCWFREQFAEYPDVNVDPRYFGEIFYRKNGFGHLLSTNYHFKRRSPYQPLTGDAVPRPF